MRTPANEIGPFTRTLAAVRRADVSTWEIADAVLTDVGPPGPDGVNDGSSTQFRALSETLASEGYVYSADTLRRFRNTAFAFPAGSRLPAASFYIHLRLVWHPELLAELAARAEAEGRRVDSNEAKRAVSNLASAPRSNVVPLPRPRVVRLRPTQQLHGRRPAQHGVACAINLAHAALANLLFERVLPEL